MQFVISVTATYSRIKYNKRQKMKEKCLQRKQRKKDWWQREVRN